MSLNADCRYIQFVFVLLFTGFTAAHLVVKNADLKNLKVLVKNGADVNVPVSVILIHVLFQIYV